ncbi:regulator of chromosome condensation isoform X3 [Rhinolophus ferrumequinum]|uniref:regulator of chromosome condensation isoform X3 n=1 Tax=Rhinolophus ferrumequinum TaxID=59479 RepID=UPI00140F6815|nr:regulator of chromosome condensation isoform X3 [Rhinolophus ferrumequinum]
MPPKRVTKRRSPPEDAFPKSKKVKNSPNRAVRASASRRVPGAHSFRVSHRSHNTEPGLVLTLGQGDVGQLGLGENVMERKKPALVPIPEDIVQAEAGGMHTVCLSKSGQVYSFGCNDEGALGRDTSVEGSEMVPGKVELQEKVVQVSAGDSHTAALTEDGRVFLWGSFRDNNGVIGLLEPMKKSMVPVQVQLSVSVVKVASGNDHLVMLTADGDLYTLGCGEQGQLGRVPELFANRGGRQGLERLLVPKCVMLKSRGSRGHVKFQDAFCGAYFTFAISLEGHVYGFGLSNYHQLGTPGTESCFVPQNLTSFKNSTKSWAGFSGGQHHTVCMDSEGRVFAWGMGTNFQLGTGQEEDAWSPVEMTGKQLENRMVLSVSSGGQHTVLLVKDKEQS